MRLAITTKQGVIRDSKISLSNMLLESQVSVKLTIWSKLKIGILFTILLELV